MPVVNQRPILPPSCTTGSSTWAMEYLIKKVLQQEPDPSIFPPNHLFIASSVHSKFIDWFPTEKLFCHPGISRTIALITHNFWLPSLHKEYIHTFHVCAQNKTINNILQHSTIPKCTCSPIALDFITGFHLLYVSVCPILCKGMTTTVT